MNIIHAQALAPLPETADLPADIQVFPPGDAVEFTLQDYPDQTFAMRVDESVAAKAQADLARMKAAELQGRGSAPFADKNHEDAEATFTPLIYFWAGSHPKDGGVRVVPQWTPFGAQLVKAKAFKYFSGNFLFDKAAKAFKGLINENIGGLVNRPGFAALQAFAKAATTSPALMSSGVDLGGQYGLDLSTSQAEHPFLKLVEAAAVRADVSLDDNDLWLRVANWEPALFDSFKKWLTEQLFVEPKLRLNALQVVSHQKREAGIFPADAWQQAQAEIPAHASAPASVEAYHRARRAFDAHARAFAAERGITAQEGHLLFAKTATGRWLNEQCR